MLILWETSATWSNQFGAGTGVVSSYTESQSTSWSSSTTYSSSDATATTFSDSNGANVGGSGSTGLTSNSRSASYSASFLTSITEDGSSRTYSVVGQMASNATQAAGGSGSYTTSESDTDAATSDSSSGSYTNHFLVSETATGTVNSVSITPKFGPGLVTAPIEWAYRTSAYTTNGATNRPGPSSDDMDAQGSTTYESTLSSIYGGGSNTASNTYPIDTITTTSYEGLSQSVVYTSTHSYTYEDWEEFTTGTETVTATSGVVTSSSVSRTSNASTGTGTVSYSVPTTTTISVTTSSWFTETFTTAITQSMTTVDGTGSYATGIGIRYRLRLIAEPGEQIWTVAFTGDTGGLASDYGAFVSGTETTIRDFEDFATTTETIATRELSVTSVSYPGVTYQLTNSASNVTSGITRTVLSGPLSILPHSTSTNSISLVATVLQTISTSSTTTSFTVQATHVRETSKPGGTSPRSDFRSVITGLQVLPMVGSGEITTAVVPAGSVIACGSTSTSSSTEHTGGGPGYSVSHYGSTLGCSGAGTSTRLLLVWKRTTVVQTGSQVTMFGTSPAYQATQLYAVAPGDTQASESAVHLIGGSITWPNAFWSAWVTRSRFTPVPYPGVSTSSAGASSAPSFYSMAYRRHPTDTVSSGESFFWFTSNHSSLSAPVTASASLGRGVSAMTRASSYTLPVSGTFVSVVPPGFTLALNPGGYRTVVLSKSASWGELNPASGMTTSWNSHVAIYGSIGWWVKTTAIMWNNFDIVTKTYFSTRQTHTNPSSIGA